MDGDNGWRQSVMDALEVVNAKHHRIWNQLKGFQKALEYLSKLAYKVYIEDCKDSTSKPDEWDNWGVVGQGMWEAGVGTSKVLSGEMDGAQGGACKVAKDWGEGLSRLTLMDKGKARKRKL